MKNLLTTLDPNETGAVYQGTKSFKATYNAAWGGMYLHHRPGSILPPTHLSFVVRSPVASPYLEIEAYGVMIFPRVVRAGLLLGGEGGNGVLVARGSDGTQSAPAFYSIGGGSAGLQAGYREASIVLVFVNRRELDDAIDGGLKLGADASVAAGTVGDTGEARTATTASDIVQFVDVGGGVFAGDALDGSVIAPRNSHNATLYGSGVTPRQIVLERR